MEENIELCLVSDKEIHNDILQALDLPVNEIKSDASGVDIWISKTQGAFAQELKSAKAIRIEYTGGV